MLYILLYVCICRSTLLRACNNTQKSANTRILRLIWSLNTIKMILIWTINGNSTEKKIQQNLGHWQYRTSTWPCFYVYVWDTRRERGREKGEEGAAKGTWVPIMGTPSKPDGSVACLFFFVAHQTGPPNRLIYTYWNILPLFHIRFVDRRRRRHRWWWWEKNIFF